MFVCLNFLVATFPPPPPPPHPLPKLLDASACSWGGWGRERVWREGGEVKKKRQERDRSRGKGSGREAIFADSGFVPGVRKNGGASRIRAEDDAAGARAELSPHGVSSGR